MVGDAPIRSADVPRPRIDFTIVEVDNRSHCRELGMWLVCFCRPVANVIVVAFIAKLGNSDWFAEAGYTIVSGFCPLNKRRVVTDLEPTTIALVWLLDRDDDVTQAFVGVTKGRTANTSR